MSHDMMMRHAFSALLCPTFYRVHCAKMAVVSSAANLLAQLDEEDEALRLNALQSLNNVVHDFWFQIASSIASVEAFYEDESFTHRELAALVASKVWSSVKPSRMWEVIAIEPKSTSNKYPSHSRILLASVQLPSRKFSPI